MRWSLNLGKIFGIRILVHWTFLILIAWVVFRELSRGSTTATTIITVAFILVIFLCVVLHELGHALAARRYGIETRKITLLPIGGVASLERMPEEPKKELIIAVAGPAVNVAIALILLPFVSLDLFLSKGTESEAAFDVISTQNFLPLLLLVNIMLVVFNAIPAFPMDGGRILRALLAMKLDRVKATKIAANLGQILAIGFVFAGLLINPFLILIGIFVFFGAYSENMMVQHLELLKGYTVRDAMMTNISTIHPFESIKVAVDKLLSGSDQDFIVEDEGKPVGLITRATLMQAIKENGTEIKANQVMQRDIASMDINQKLPDVYTLMQKKKNSYFPVLDNGKLVGAINSENISEFVMVQSALH